MSHVVTPARPQRPAAEPGPAQPEPARPPRFRGDVEGLRAVAIGLVLLYHAGLPVFRGGFVGVDVFFVISGYLITGQLLKEVDSTGRVSLVRFYARRAKRLLPATGIVLVATVAMVLLWVPKIRWESIGGDVVSAALYVVNWRLAAQSVDYLAEDVPPSPVQHFWSLAVEEQYYLIWPLLVLLVTLWAHRIGRRGRPRPHHLWLGLALVAVPSFLWSVRASGRSTAAFFLTTTRMWELAVGAAVAIGVAGWARWPRRFALVVGWGGLAAVAAAGLLYTTDLTWPGYAAALPVLGTAAVIAAGPAAGPAGPVVVLGTGPFRWVGALSYSLYLWHWPLLVVAAAALGSLSAPLGLLVVLVSFVPAWLAFTLVESPLRHSRALSGSPRLALSVGGNFTLVGVVAGLVLVLAIPASTAVPAGAAKGAQALRPAAKASASARATTGAPVDRVAFITPDPLQAPEDVPDLYARGCQVGVEDAEPVACAYGPRSGATSVVVVGDSKAAQWMPAIARLAGQRNWRVVSYTKSACSFSDAPVTVEGRPYDECTEWNRRVMDLLRRDPPDYVVTSQVRPVAYGAKTESPRAAMVDGLRTRWQDVAALGSKVVVLADTLHPPFPVYECVAEHTDHLTACAFDRRTAVRRSASSTLRTAARESGAAYVDLTDDICPTSRCAPVIGNVLVYRQGSHITATYVDSLTAALGRKLAAAEQGLAG